MWLYSGPCMDYVLLDQFNKVLLRSACTPWVREWLFQSGHMATNDPCLFLPRSSLGTSDTSSLILLKIISKRARGVQSTHPEAFNYEETRRSVRWWCRRRCASPGYMLLSSRGVRTMYPRLCARISFRFEQVQGLYAGGKKEQENKTR